MFGLKGGNGWDFGHFGQESLFHFIELTCKTIFLTGGLVAQAVRRSPLTAGGSEFTSRLLHVCFVVIETGYG